MGNGIWFILQHIVFLPLFVNTRRTIRSLVWERKCWRRSRHFVIGYRFWMLEDQQKLILVSVYGIRKGCISTPILLLSCFDVIPSSCTKQPTFRWIHFGTCYGWVCCKPSTFVLSFFRWEPSLLWWDSCRGVRLLSWHRCMNVRKLFFVRKTPRSCVVV